MKRLLFYFCTICLCTFISKDSFAQSSCGFQLEVGQIEKYIFFTTNDNFFFPPPDSIQTIYTGDTLIVEVIEELAPNTFIIQESLSPHSNVFYSSTNYFYGNPDDVFEQHWTFVNDSLLITNPLSGSWQSSHLTYFAKGVALNPPLSNITTFIDWKPFPPFGSHTYNRIINGQEYNRLIVHIDNSPMAADGPGMTMTYEKAYGIVSSFTTSAWFGTSQGWMKL